MSKQCSLQNKTRRRVSRVQLSIFLSLLAKQTKSRGLCELTKNCAAKERGARRKKPNQRKIAQKNFRKKQKKRRTKIGRRKSCKKIHRTPHGGVYFATPKNHYTANRKNARKMRKIISTKNPITVDFSFQNFRS